MARKKFTFPNDKGIHLSALLETPDPAVCQGSPRAYAVFAHCFTCGKNMAAASRISRALTAKGIAVLRFDFTGLGNSDGDFGNSGFSANVLDLVSACNYLEQNYSAPELLIGHSLGGAAVLCAAHHLPRIRAVATIGAPSTADHVTHLFKDAESEIEEKGEAQVDLAGRKFVIKNTFLQDLRQYASPENIRKLRKALLVMHAPLDNIVEVGEAAKIFSVAMHPKSFVSLDGADHLLTDKKDSEYVAGVIAGWVEPYLTPLSKKQEDKKQNVALGEVLVHEADKNFTRGLEMHNHQMLADEPRNFGGLDLGPSPYELLVSALGACTSMTIRMYAKHKKIKLDNVQVRVKHDRIHAQDCESCEGESGYIERFQRWIALSGDLTQQERTRLLEIANRCPVHKTLESEKTVIETVETDSFSQELSS